MPSLGADHFYSILTPFIETGDFLVRSLKNEALLQIIFVVVTARGPSNMFVILNYVNSTWASTNLIIEQSNTPKQEPGIQHVQFSS